MTRTLVLLAHPHLDRSRVNSALAQAASQQEHVTVRDLYALYPDSKIDVQAEQQALLAADRIVLQYPTYWYSVPPLLKAWQDDVLTYGWAFGPSGDALPGKRLLVATSTGTAADTYTEEGFNQVAYSTLLAPLKATANMIGTVFEEPVITHGSHALDQAGLDAAAQAYASRI